MRRDQDRPFFVEVIIEQVGVELFAKQDIESQCRFVEYQQLGVDCHDDCEVQLGDHALGQLFYLGARLHLRLAQQLFGPSARKVGVHGLDIVKQLFHPDPPRQHGNVGDETDFAHQLLSLPERIQADHRQIAVAIRKPEHGFQQGCLAGTVRTYQSQYFAFLNLETDVVDGTYRAEMFRHTARCDQASHACLPRPPSHQR